MTSFTAAKHNPSKEARSTSDDVHSPAPVRRRDPGPGVVLTERVLDDILQDLREAQSVLDECDPSDPTNIWTGKGVLRLKLDFVQSMLGGVDEWGRRADGSRPSDQRKGKAA